MRTKSFVWDAKADGWKPETQPTFTAGPGFLVAHDVLEHFNDDPAFKNELLAFGSTLYGRFHDDNIMIDVSSDDLSSFLIDEHFEIDVPSQRWNKPLADPVAEQQLKAFIRRTGAKAVLKSVLSGSYAPSHKIQEAVERCEVWIRLGYRIAARRFIKRGPYAVRRLFGLIADAVNDDHDEYAPKAGDRLTIELNTETLDFSLQRSHVTRHRAHKPAAARELEPA